LSYFADKKIGVKTLALPKQTNSGKNTSATSVLKVIKTKNYDTVKKPAVKTVCFTISFLSKFIRQQQQQRPFNGL